MKFWFISLLLVLSSCIDESDIQLNIEKTMNRQVSEWNNRNIIGFMEPYWHSDSLRFMGKSGVTKGWQATLSRYQKNYKPDKMGNLNFSDIHFDILSAEAAWVDGQWKLSYPDTTIAGRFSLLWKKFNGKWQIVADHSS